VDFIVLTGEAFSIVEVTSIVGLQDIPFDLYYKVSFNRSDEDIALDTIFTSVFFGGDLLSHSNASFFYNNGIRQVEFNAPGILLRNTGKQLLEIKLSLANQDQNGTSPIQTDTRFGIWVVPGPVTLVPLLVTMVVAVASRNVLPALFFGVLC